MLGPNLRVDCKYHALATVSGLAAIHPDGLGIRYGHCEHRNRSGIGCYRHESRFEAGHVGHDRVDRGTRSIEGRLNDGVILSLGFSNTETSKNPT